MKILISYCGQSVQYHGKSDFGQQLRDVILKNMRIEPAQGTKVPVVFNLQDSGDIDVSPVDIQLYMSLSNGHAQSLQLLAEEIGRAIKESGLVQQIVRKSSHEDLFSFTIMCTPFKTVSYAV